MHEYTAEYGKQGFDALMRQLVAQIQIALANELPLDFNAFDDMLSHRQEQMIKFAYLVHMRIGMVRATQTIHGHLDNKIARMEYGIELNRRESESP